MRFFILLCFLVMINVVLFYGVGEFYFLMEMFDMVVVGCYVMVKFGGVICNIDCIYCFYFEKEVLYLECNKNW